MVGLNKVIFIGNVGNDPDIRYTKSEIAVSNLRLGVTERRKEGSGWKNHTEWVNIVCFGKLAENVGRFVKKGKQIYVEGRLQTRMWENKSGESRMNIEVVANILLFLGSRGVAQDTIGLTPVKPELSLKKRPAEDGPDVEFDRTDDVPF